MTWEQYKYVINIFRKNFPEFYLLSYNNANKSLIDSKMREIIFNVCKNELSRFSKDDYNNDYVENRIYDVLNKQLDNYFSKDKRDSINEKFTYICSDKFVSKYDGLCSYDLIRYMAGQILVILYDKDITLSDDKINLHYSELYTRIINNIKGRVENIVQSEMEFADLKKINYNQLVDSIVRKLMINFDDKYLGLLEKINIDIDKNLDKEFDREIINLFNYGIREEKKSNVSNVKQKEVNKQEVVDYIYTYLSSKYGSKLNLDDYSSCTTFIYKKLIISNNFNMSDIVNHKYDSMIDNFFGFWINSCNVSNVSVEKEYEPRTRKNYKSVIALLLAGALVIGGASVAAYNYNRDKKIESAAVHIMLEDGFLLNDDTSSVFDYSYNTNKVLEIYNKRVDLLPNERCDYIAFSECYLQLDKSIGTKLSIMDKLLSNVIFESNNGRGDNRFYYDNVGNRCYLELMYDSLRYMGYDDIDQVQYDVLLEQYIKTKKQYPNEKDIVSKMSVIDRNLIKKIEEEYVKLSKEKLRDIAFLPIYGDVNSVSSVRGGK